MLRDLAQNKYPELAAILPARFNSLEQALEWANKLGIEETKARKMLDSIEGNKKAIEFRKMLHQYALKNC